MKTLRHLRHLLWGTTNDDIERGDVPGWVLITLMTAALVVAIWTVAQSQLIEVFENAISKISVI